MFLKFLNLLLLLFSLPLHLLVADGANDDLFQASSTKPLFVTHLTQKITNLFRAWLKGDLETGCE